MEGSEYISVAAASQALGVSLRTTRRWCTAGRLRAQKQGRAHEIELSSVAALKQELASRSKPKPRPTAETRIEAPEEAPLAAIRQAEEALAMSQKSVASAATATATAAATEKNMAHMREQVETLATRLDRMSQLQSDWVKSLQRADKKLAAMLNALAIGVVGLAVAMAIAFVGVATTLF